MDRGWVKQWRKEKDSLIFRMPPMYFKVWRYLLIEANHQANIVPVDGKPFKVLPGQKLTSVKQIAQACAFEENNKVVVPSNHHIRNILAFLVKNDMIAWETRDKKYSLITILNWDKYQGQWVEPGTYRGHTGDINKNDKNEKNKYIRQVQEVFSYWQEVMDHPRAKLTKGRRTKITARLEEGYTAEQIKQAIDGCKGSKYHMGENEQQSVYDDLTLICRNGEKLEIFIHKAERKPEHTFVT